MIARSLLLPLLLAALVVRPAVAQTGGVTRLVSFATNGDQANSTCDRPSMSADGRYIAFDGHATTLVNGDTNGVVDVFVRDVLLETTVRVSVDSAGAQGNGTSESPVISGDGRYVAFLSHATNLVPQDTNGVDDVFVHDLLSGITERVSVSSSGVQQNLGFVGEQLGISHDGSRIVFSSEATNLTFVPVASHRDVYLRDRSTLTTQLVSFRPPIIASDGVCHRATLSADGNVVAFQSHATNLVLGDTNQDTDIFVFDLGSNTIERVSLGDQGQQGFSHAVESSLSADGSLVAFDSLANNLFPGDGNGVSDVFVFDRALGTSRLASFALGGGAANGISSTPVLNATGSHVMFRTKATDVYVGDVNSTTTDLVLRDLATDEIEHLTVSTDGRSANVNCRGGDLSADATLVCFSHRDRRHLVYGDLNTDEDIFLRDRTATWPQPYCPEGENSLGCATALTVSGTPSASAGTGFTVSANGILNGQTVVLFYSLTGADDRVFYAGTLCIEQPFLLGPIASSGGGGPPGTNCLGNVQFDLNAFGSQNPGAGWTVGTSVWIQAIHRDPGFHPSRGAVLTNAVVFAMGP